MGVQQERVACLVAVRAVVELCPADGGRRQRGERTREVSPAGRGLGETYAELEWWTWWLRDGIIMQLNMSLTSATLWNTGNGDQVKTVELASAFVLS